MPVEWLADWCAFYELAPWDAHRDDLRMEMALAAFGGDAEVRPFYPYREIDDGTNWRELFEEAKAHFRPDLVNGNGSRN